jgi:hypothetical protein
MKSARSTRNNGAFPLGLLVVAQAPEITQSSSRYFFRLAVRRATRSGSGDHAPRYPRRQSPRLSGLYTGFNCRFGTEYLLDERVASVAPSFQRCLPAWLMPVYMSHQ